MPSLSRGFLSGTGQSATKGFVVGPGGETSALEVKTEVFDGEEQGEQFLVESTVVLLRGRQLPRKEPKGFAGLLCQNSTNSDIRSIGSEVEVR